MESSRTHVGWFANACIALAALLGAGACSEGEAASSAEKLFTQQGCVTCHGDHGQGSMLGPSLTGASAHWTREQLVAYLADPQGYAAKDPRLSKQGLKYFQPMPTFKMLAPEELASLAEYVLKLP